LAQDEVLESEVRTVPGERADQGQSLEEQSRGGGSTTAAIDGRSLAR
jgi:hypothetical protein